MPKKTLADRFFTDPVPPNARIYILSVVASGIPIFLYSLYVGMVHTNMRWLSLAALTAVASAFPVKIPLIQRKSRSVTLAMGDVFVFTSILLYGPPVGALMAFVEGVVTNCRARIQRPYRWAFNLSQLVLVSYLVGHLFYRMEDKTPPLDASLIQDPGTLLVEVGLCGLIYFAVNTGLVATALALVTRQSFFDLWRQNFIWSSVTHFVGASLGALIFIYFREFKFYSVAVATPILMLVYYAYRMNLGRIKQTQEHLEQVSELLAEKIQAEKALQKAKDELELRVQERTAELRAANQQLLVEIRERREAEQALAAEKERLDVTLRSIGDGVITTDTKGRIFLLNKAAEELTGWSQEEAFEKPLGEVLRILDARTRTEQEDLVGRVLKTGEVLTLEGRDTLVVARNGKERHVSQNVAPIRNDEGSISGVVVVFQDVSEQLQAEEALRKSQEQLQQAQKMEAIGRLAGGIAHDFNNLLTVILGYCNLLLSQQVPAFQYKERVEEIKKAAERAASLTRQLLAFSRKQVLQPKLVNLNSVVADMNRMLRRLIGEDVELITLMDSKLGLVSADPGQLEQVIMNLVVNARDAMPHGGKLIIETANVESYQLPEECGLKPGPYVMLSVKDTGEGIPPEIQDQIFEPFFTTKKGTGTGLGLATVYGIVQQSGGQILVESGAQEGACFRIFLPRARVSTIGPRLSLAPSAGAPAGAETVLLVEDEEGVRALVQSILRQNGYQVLVAHNGQEALKIVKRHPEPIDLLVTDVIMPQMNGVQLVEKVLEHCPHIRVIYMSGYTDNAVLQKMVLGPGKLFLQKPFSPAELTSKVRAVLDLKLPAQGSNQRLAESG